MKLLPADPMALHALSIEALCQDLSSPALQSHGFIRTDALRAARSATDELGLPAIRGELQEQIGEAA